MLALCYKLATLVIEKLPDDSSQILSVGDMLLARFEGLEAAEDIEDGLWVYRLALALEPSDCINGQ